MLFLKKSKVIQIDFVTKSKKEYKKEYKEYNLEYKEYTEYTKKFVLAKKKKCTLLYSKEYNLVTLVNLVRVNLCITKAKMSIKIVFN